MNFGKWILVSFILFAVFIATLVTVCVREDVSLVSKSYYQEELAHEVKMDKIRNTQALSVVPDLNFVDGRLQITYDDLKKVENGTIRLLRPSDSGLDHTFQLSASNGTVQNFSLPASDRGLYRATVQWSMDGKDFLFEKLIVL